MRHRRWILFGTLFAGSVAVWSFASLTSLAGQTDPCPDVAREGNVSTLDEYATSESACVIQTAPPGPPDPARYAWAPSNSDLGPGPGGAFIKKDKYVKLDAHAISSGKCDRWLMDGGGNCIFWNTQTRNLVKINIRTVRPSGSETLYWIWPRVNPTQDMDTRVPNTTPGTIREWLNALGPWRFLYQSTINKTDCNIEPGFSPLKEITLNALSCRPVWNEEQPRTWYLPAQPISVYIPDTMPELYVPADDAILDWNLAVAGTGRPSITRVTAPCGTGGDCVNVEEGGSIGCADTLPGSFGEISLPSRIRFTAGWRTRPPSRNRRTMAHELGHLYGLGNYACPETESLMGPATGGCSSAPGPGTPLGPTPVNDVLPTTGSTYGNKVQKSCGF